MTTTTYTVTPSPVKPNVPLWLTGHQCPRIEYNPTSEYKLKKGDKTGWGVIVQYTSRSQKEMNAIYVGGLEERRAEGYGEWHSEDMRLSYHGGWKDNVASGYGKYCDGWTVDWPDSWARFLPGESDTDAKVTYEGGFKDGVFHGYGVLSFKDRSKYEGTWKNGRRWGYGKYTKDDGTVIEFQVEGAVKKEKKDEKKPEKKEELKAQIIYVQGQPQLVQSVGGQPVMGQPVVAQPIMGQGQQLLQVAQPTTEHQAQAGITLAWGHGSPQAQTTQPTYYFQPVASQPLDIPRPLTPIPAAYTMPPRPLTPNPHRGSQQYVLVPPNQLVPPYPSDGTSSGSPPGTIIHHV